MEVVQLDAEKKNLPIICDLNFSHLEEQTGSVVPFFCVSSNAPLLTCCLHVYFFVYSCRCDYVRGDARRVRQIAINLLSNAVKFSTKGEIVLTATVILVGHVYVVLYYCQMSNVKCHMSHVTCRTSHVTCHTSQGTLHMTRYTCKMTHETIYCLLERWFAARFSLHFIFLLFFSFLCIFLFLCVFFSFVTQAV